MTNEQDKQHLLHLQELRSYRFTVENLLALVAELEAQLAAAQQAAQAAEGVPAQFGTGVAACIDKLNWLQQEHPWNLKQSEALSEAITALESIAATHPTQQGLDADMFWDADDPERCESSINNVVVEVDSCRGLRVGDIVTIQRAVRLPNLEVRITQCPDAEGNGDLEWDEVDASQAKQGEQA